MVTKNLAAELKSLTSSELAAEVLVLEGELCVAKEHLEKATAHLQRLESHLPPLVSLVDKQVQHLSALETESQVVSLPDYRDMRMSHNQHRNQIIEGKTLIAQVKKDVRERTAALVPMEDKLAVVRAEMNSRGVLLEFRKKS